MKKVLLILALVFGFTIAIAQNINTFAGQTASGAVGDGGPAISAFTGPTRGICKDAVGNIYIAQIDGKRIRKVDVSGIITTYAGDGIGGGATGDGGLATSAKLGVCHGIAMDGSGNLYIADQSNHKIRKVNSAGIITTYVGTGALGFAGDGGPASSAKLNNPVGIAVDVSGNLYIADANNQRIRKVNTSGIISTVAGTGVGGYSGDGGVATLAKINMPESVAVDGAGNIYLTDASYTVRKINTAGIISTVAGNTVWGFAGDGGPATSAQISSKAVAVDSYGNLYLADFPFHVVRFINTAGIISTIAGQDGLTGFSGDGGNPLSALLSYPYGLLVDGSCNLYISDQGNSRVRIITGSGCYVGINELEGNSAILVYPNPSSGQVSFDGVVENNLVEVMDITGRLIFSHTSYSNNPTIDLSNLDKGMYLYRITDEQNKIQQGKVILR